MSDEIPTQAVEETQPVAQEQPAQGEQSAQEGEEGAGQQPKPVEKYKAWEKPLGGPPKDIPYHRFQEVNTERNTFKTQLEETNARLQEAQAKLAEFDNLRNSEEPDPANYEDPKKFLQARDAWLLKRVEAQQQEKEAIREQERAVQEVGAAYMSRIEAAKQRDPEISKAESFFNENAHLLNPVVARELMTDENVGELLLDIATDQKAIEAVFGNDPMAAIRAINRISGRINLESRYSKPTESVPTAIEQKQRIGASLPTQIKPTSKSIPTSLTAVSKALESGNMSTAQYREWRKAQK